MRPSSPSTERGIAAPRWLQTGVSLGAGSKVHPVALALDRGGGRINAALRHGDRWESQGYDTVKGAGYLGDQDAAQPDAGPEPGVSAAGAPSEDDCGWARPEAHSAEEPTDFGGLRSIRQRPAMHDPPIAGLA